VAEAKAAVVAVKVALAVVKAAVAVKVVVAGFSDSGRSLLAHCQ
jgi:hypothetical protein